VLSPAKLGSREGEIVEVLLRRGWDYMRRLLSGGKTDEPNLPPPAVFRNILTDLGPVFVKLGQLLSTRPDLLPPVYIEALSSLQSQVPPVEWGEIETVIRQQLPVSLDEAFADISRDAIAAGSIGQTHKATLKDGRAVALKVQRPGIASIVAQDIALIKNLAQLVAKTNFGQSFDIVALADEFGSALQAELNFTQEARYTDQLRQNLSKSRWFDPKQVMVPEIVWPLTTPKLLVMEWLDGQPLLTADFQPANTQTNRMKPNQNGSDATRTGKEIATLLIRVFLQQFLIDGFFHADPHPGNLFYLNDGRVAILDCGMMGHLDTRTRSVLTELILAIVSSDAQRCTQLSLQLTEPMQPVDLVRLEKDYDRLLRRYSNLSLSQIDASQAFQEILQAGTRNHLRWPGNIGLFAKSLANLEGSGRQLNPSLNIEDEIEPLVADLFQYELIGDRPLQAVLRTVLEFKNLSLASPRQFSFLLNRLSTESLKLNLSIKEIDLLRRSIDDAANRRTVGTVVSALIIGAAIISTAKQTAQLHLLSNILFAAASLFGVWLMVSILRSGRLK